MSADNLFTSEVITAIYTINGKTMIGKFVTYPSESDIGSGANVGKQKEDTGIFSKLLGDPSTGKIDHSKYFYVKNPAEIVYELKSTEEGTAELTWNIVPLVYRIIKNNQATDVVVAYEKSQISISDATMASLDSDLVNAYTEIS